MRLRGRREHRASEAGFTLIEVLVSLILLSLVLSALPSSIRFLRGTWDAAGRLDRQEAQQGARELMTARLSEALPLFDTAPNQPLKLLFTGRPDLLSFVAPSFNGPEGPGLYQFELAALTKASGAMSLVVRLQLHGAAAAGSRVEERTLIEDAANVTFRYLGRDGRLGAPAWSDQWTRLDGLPDAVELTVMPGRGRGSPPMQRVFVELRLRGAS